MGIFGSQGEYAKLAPLFVDKFDTEPTFSKINSELKVGDELSRINATTAMSHEQGLANAIHQKHQEVISKVNSGEMSPFQYSRMAKETAHAYVNDATRRNVETSYKANEASIQANKDKDASYGTRQKNEGYHAAQGGSEVMAMTPWNSPENFDATDWAAKISNMTNADKEVNGPRVGVGPAGTLAIAKDDHEFITRQKVAQYGRQLLDSNPSAKAYLEDMAYGDLYNQAYAGLVNNPNTTGLSEKDKKALIYQHLNTPVKKVYERTVRDKEGKPVKDAKGNVVKEKQEYTITPLQEEVEKRKEQMVNGVAGLTAFDKYDASLSLHNAPDDGSKKKSSDELAGGYAQADDFEKGSPYVDKYQAETAEEVESATSLGRTIGANALTGTINTGKALLDGALTILNFGTTGPNASKSGPVKFEPMTDRATRLGKMLPDVKLELERNGIKTSDIPAVKADGSNLDLIRKQLLAKSEQSEALKRQKYLRPAARIADKNLGDLLSRVDINSDKLDIKNEDGEKTSAKFSEIVKNPGDFGIEIDGDVKDKGEIEVANYLQKNIKVSEITSRGGNIWIKGSIGTKDIYLPVKDVTMKNAYSGLASVDELFKADFKNGKSFVKVPEINKGRLAQGYTKIVKQVKEVPKPEGKGAPDMVVEYYYEKPDGTRGVNTYNSDQISREYAGLAKFILQGTDAYNEVYTNKTK